MIINLIFCFQDAGFPKSTLDTCNSDLVYRSNDIPASPVDNQPIAEDADDDYEENGELSQSCNHLTLGNNFISFRNFLYFF